ncbi:MAG: hypothetical protein JG774_713 [Desulfomicrobiaceae bacterium]|jgi:predicted Zn finger-like uncharacterized protein|nr:zinc-ribbon domain-containing protein [Desulfomicrobiaceae bacterium]MBZ4647781.1 hypothetical protein [Desulfomicrobiaceae bacterium]MBZ4684968.1 hypothetical protein [Desulfomicrobiaceae bacterium]MDI3492531.1 hypothetical protein [Desulfomicrobiaceae bacterium]MDK2872574.1 hypothetical protein [Desulfomicrobiaceae bacterium]
MEIRCHQCDARFVLPPERIPEARRFKVSCPQCKQPILVERPEAKKAQTSAAVPDEPEYFPHDAHVAFVYVQQAALHQRICDYVRNRGGYVSEARSIDQAMAKIRANYYHEMIFQDDAEGRQLLEVVATWNGLRRREVNVILVESDRRTLSGMDAFLVGVNAVISSKDSAEIEKFLDLARDAYKAFQEPWKIAAAHVHGVGIES